jgi:hypothetical protein
MSSKVMARARITPVTSNSRSGKRDAGRPPRCPVCGSKDSVEIVYGLPGAELIEASERGEVAIGGCVVMEDGSDPDRRCRVCETEWVTSYV